MYPSVSTTKECIICRKPGATGQWQLCPTCRDRLKEKSAQFVASAKPPACFGCGAPRPSHSTSCGAYCRSCRRRYNAEPKR